MQNIRQKKIIFIIGIICIVILAVFLFGASAKNVVSDLQLKGLTAIGRGKVLPATIWVGPANRTEPVDPGSIQPVSGCGYKPGVNIRITDEVTYSNPVFGQLPPNFAAPIGQKASITFDAGSADANGCMVNWWYQGWGIGGHTMRAYQISSGNKYKEMANTSFSASPHHPHNMFNDNNYTEFCLAYKPTPTPYNGPVADTLPTTAYSCQQDPTAPSLSITSPSASTTLYKNSEVIVSADASGGTGTAIVIFYLNDYINCVIEAPPYDCTVTTPNYNNEILTVTTHSPGLMNYRSRIMQLMLQ